MGRKRYQKELKKKEGRALFFTMHLAMWCRMMRGMVHRMVPVVMHNPAVVYRVVYLRTGKTCQSDEQSDSQ